MTKFTKNNKKLSEQDKETAVILDENIKRIKKGHERTLDALQEGFELYQTLFEISPEAINLIDLKFNIIMGNQQSAYLHGVENIDELIGKSVFDVVLPRDKKQVRTILELIIKSGKPQTQERCLVRSDGSVFMADITVSVIKNVKGDPVALISVVRDVTERKNIEQALMESELRYRTLTEASIAGIYIIQDDKFIYVNPALCEMFGYSQEEVINKYSYNVLTHPQDRIQVTRQLKKRFQNKADEVRTIFRGLRKDGSVIYCQSLGRVIELNGKPAIIGTLIDITERKKMEEKLAYKYELNNIITYLSTKFINLNPQDVEAGIDDALKIIGEFAQVDRSYVFLFSNDHTKVDNTNEWCAIGINSQIKKLKKIPVEKFPWIFKKIKKGETVCVPRLEDLPAGAKAEKYEWKKENIRSLINVPMIYLGQVIGFVGFDAVKEEREWDEDIQILLGIVGNLFATIIERRQMERDIKSLNKELLKTNMHLKQLALKDSLTNLYNHRYFAEAIEAEFIRAKRYALPLSVIMVDIDYFKSINDVYGHQFGDLVLKQLAGQLTNMVRKYDTVIRYGGEEFVIITPGANKEIAMILAQRLLDLLKLNKFGNEQHGVKLKLSVAVVCFPEDKIHQGSNFIEIAEYVLNKVKETGGDKIYSYSDLKKRKEISMLDAEVTTDVNVLKDQLDKLTKRANQSLVEAIFAFAKTIEIKDHCTGEHVEKTVHYATEIAMSFDLSEDEIERIRQAAILHDLGKIGISEKILRKKTKLTKKEYEEIKTHPQVGADILRPIHFFHSIIPFILHHHEHWDGKGYPFGLKGEEIPLGARIIAVADTFEAITSDRYYRKAASVQTAIKIIKEVSGTQFDPKIVEVFLQVIQKEQKRF
ncbi:MAG: PAS domain S-box protein [Candidatus Omnitrophota bacterium]